MSLTITLPADLALLLSRAASAQDRPAEVVAIDILRATLLQSDTATIDDVIAFLRAAPPNPANFRPARGSLAEILAKQRDAEFDHAPWEAEWAQAVAEIAVLSEDNTSIREP